MTEMNIAERIWREMNKGEDRDTTDAEDVVAAVLLEAVRVHLDTSSYEVGDEEVIAEANAAIVSGTLNLAEVYRAQLRAMLDEAGGKPKIRLVEPEKT